MTKHTMVTFQLHRKGVILIVIGCVLLAVLLVAMGYLFGTTRVRAKTAAAPPAVQPAKAMAKPAATAAPKEQLTLRVALVTSEAEAKDIVARMAVKKLAATVVPVETNEKEVVYEVHVGRYPDRKSAVDAARTLHDHGIDSAVVPAQ